MYALFGAAVQSSATLVPQLAQRYSTALVRGTHHTRRALQHSASGAQVVVFDTWRDFKQSLPALARYRGVAVLLETPLRLAEVPGLIPLDYSTAESWNFRFAPVAWSVFEGHCAAAFACRRHVPLRLHNIDHLAALIERQLEGRFLNHFQPLLYATTNHSNREALRQRLTTWLCSSEPASAFVPPFRFRGAGAEMLANFLLLIENSGDDFRAALQACAASRGRKNAKGVAIQPNYKSIARRYGVDSYELRYLMNVRHRTLTHTRQSLTDIAHTFKANMQPKAKPKRRAA